MSLIASNKAGWIISHDLFIRNMYEKTYGLEKNKSFSLKPALFDIQVPFVKSRFEQFDLNESTANDILFVKKAHESLCELYTSLNLPLNIKSKNNESARTLASNFYKKFTRHPNTGFHGGNNSQESLVTKIEDEMYLIPEESSFYCYDIMDVTKHLEGKQFDFILIDPPWWNKFIRRKRKKDQKLGYDMIFNKDLTEIPVNSLLSINGIVGVWCTNAPSHINSVIVNLFRAWNIEFVTEWYWIKITKLGKPICAFSKSLGKQPFERILFGIKNGCEFKTSNLEKNKVFMSIPSAIHSHKPPLCDLIKPFLPENPKCLELFARYLLPKWTSYGNEVLKLQHISLYEEH